MNRSLLWYYAMPLIVLFAALLQSTVANRLILRGVKPDLVLIVVVVATLIYGGKAGLTWAFVGGVGLDLFSGGPFGSSSLALLAAALVASLGHRVLSRFHLLVPLGATALGTLLYGLVYVGLLNALRTLAQLPGLATLTIPNYALPLWPVIQGVIIPALIYNTTIVLFLTPFLNRVPEHQDIL